MKTYLSILWTSENLAKTNELNYFTFMGIIINPEEKLNP